MLKHLSFLYLSLLICMHTGHAQCTGTPAAGVAVSNISSACSNDTIVLTVNNSSSGQGISYQWQLSSDSLSWRDTTNILSDTFFVVQRSTSYYRRITSCGALSAASEAVKVSAKALLQCYCKPAASNCLQGDRITRVQMGTLSNSSGCSPNGYIDYASTVPVPGFNESVTFQVSVTVSAGGTEYVALWIDYNQDGVFDANEYTAVGLGNGVTITGQVTIPGDIPTGITKMRVRMRFNIPLNNTDACSTIVYGETEDYLVNILPAPLCSGIPDGGITEASVAKICRIDSTKLIVTAATTGFTGLSYQWQKSADSIAWMNMTGDSFVSKTLRQDTTTFYRRITTCGALQAFSIPVKIITKDSTLCYCRPASSLCNSTATITAVRFSSLHNTSNCSPLGYGDYSGLAPTPVQPGVNLPVNISASSINTSLINYFGVWIDYNKNGFFENSEFTNLGSLQGNGSITGSISIPLTASTGVTGMRIRSRYNTGFSAANACTDYAISETEDYQVLIDPTCFVNVWTGLGGNNNWETVNNWSCLHLPAADETVVINAGNTVLVNSNPSIYSLILNPGAILSLTPSFNVTVAH